MKNKYYSFLVRLWASENTDGSTWRISLESSESGEKQFFTDIDGLLKFFENLIGSSSVLRGSTEED